MSYNSLLTIQDLVVGPARGEVVGSSDYSVDWLAVGSAT